MNELESLLIYKQYMELIYYTEMIVSKYPKSEKASLVATMKQTTYDGMKYIILAQKERDAIKRLQILNQLDVTLKMLKVFIRVSNRAHYISSKNYTAWAKKIFNIANLLGGWIRACLKP